MQGCTLWEAKCRNTSRDFVLWREYFQWQYSRPSRSDYYLAQLTKEVVAFRLAWGSGGTPDIKDFLIKFKQEDVIEQAPTPEEIAAKGERSKSVWSRILVGSNVPPG